VCCLFAHERLLRCHSPKDAPLDLVPTEHNSRITRPPMRSVSFSIKCNRSISLPLVRRLAISLAVARNAGWAKVVRIVVTWVSINVIDVSRPPCDMFSTNGASRKYTTEQVVNNFAVFCYIPNRISQRVRRIINALVSAIVPLAAICAADLPNGGGGSVPAQPEIVFLA